MRTLSISELSNISGNGGCGYEAPKNDCGKKKDSCGKS